MIEVIFWFTWFNFFLFFWVWLLCYNTIEIHDREDNHGGIFSPACRRYLLVFILQNKKKLTILSTLYRKAIVVFAIYRSSWLEDQPAPPLPVRLPRLSSHTLLPLLPFITSHRLPPTHTSKCTVCKSAPHRVAHLFTERCCSKPNLTHIDQK